MDLQQLCVVLQSCLSPDAQLRKGAEDLLVQHEASKGQVINLLRVAAEESVDIAVRQVAAITFKRLVRRSWDPPASDTTTYRLPEDEKTLVKDNILESLIRAPHAAQVQLGEVFKTIVYNDFPANWPGLQAGLVQNLASQEPLRVHGGLYALRLVVRKYEMRDSKGEEADTQAALVNATFPVLLHIFQQLLASPALTPDVCLYIKLVLKCFWSATYMAPPDLLLQPEHFRGWMAALLAAVHQDLPEDQQPARKEERPAMAWWKSRKWLLHYEMRDSKGEEADTQAALVNATFPVLLHIFQQLLASPALTPDVCLYIKLVLKCFWSATYMAPPDLLLQPEHFRGWMAALLAAVHQDLPEDQQPARKEERPAMAWWKSRKWLLHVTYHMFTRCGNPKHAKEGNERTFALMWAPFLDAHLALIVRLASGRYMTPRTTNLLFQYVDHCLNIKSCYK
ncbi:ARM repeat-containing protein [Haematococcus lacustris]|uniref:ARM repeat-containing protein n=1 Tax=Haematococcus lacustris TaxID=44745 RepID=A0A699Z2R3_HAELA|nr:ARM repeat-containing protein [Haematococcus lacustris]